MKEVPIDLLRQLLRYEPESGKLYWLERPVEMFSESTFRNRWGGVSARSAQWACNRWNSAYAGKEALAIPSTERGRNNGRRQGKVFGQNYYAHRMVWALHYGVWPSEMIDHEDGDPGNNRIGNLRDVSNGVNCRNGSLHSNNTSGCPGVSWYAPTQKWISRINIDGKRRSLGHFTSLEDAISARKQAENDCGQYHPNHGRAAA